MKSDGDLSKLFMTHIAKPADWQRIETFSTGMGVPDLNGCIEGHEFWVEMKVTSGWAVKIGPEQVAWAERRIRAGGRVFLAVRRKAEAGARRVEVDELWLFPGSETRNVMIGGLNAPDSVPFVTAGGPRNWDWEAVRKIISQK